MSRQIHLVAFLQAQNCTTIPAAWRHPDARPDFASAAYYQHIGKVLERGKFDVGFFDDRLAMPDMYTNDHAHTIEHGIRAVKMDAATVLMAMGMMMVPPAIVSLPFKLAFFVLADGWSLLAGALVTGYTG